MESERKIVFKELVDDVDVAKELSLLGGGNDDEEIVDITAVMMITEVVDDKTVELVEEDVRKELAGKIADDDAAALGLVKEAFRRRKIVPVGAESTNGDVAHGVIVDDLVPKELESEIKLLAVGGVTVDVVFVVVGVGKLTLEAPKDAFIKEIVTHAHKVALDVEFDTKGGLSVIVGDTTDVGGETLLSVKSAFVDATRIRVGDEMAIPPVAAKVKQEVVDDTVAERGGDDFAHDGVADDESDATARKISAVKDVLAKGIEAFDVAELETMLVDSMTFATTSALVGNPKLLKDELGETRAVRGR